tara:strand:+ start:3104 stop:3841 length:738 start_codon:yes stop_codon:yes gene_type:complete
MIIKPDILEVLSQSTANGHLLSLPADLDRNLYLRVDKVLKAAGGKWQSKKRAHVFSGESADALDQMLVTGAVTVAQDLGFFPTPLPVATEAAELLDLRDGMKVLEPNAGRADLVQPIINKAEIDCIELHEPNVEYLKTVSGLNTVTQGDFLGMDPNAIYDRVLMNPPFLRYSYARHILHAYKWLRPGGLLVAIASGNLLWQHCKPLQDVKDLIAGNGGSIKELPVDAFKPSGVMVPTVLITIPKP